MAVVMRGRGAVAQGESRRRGLAFGRGMAHLGGMKTPDDRPRDAAAQTAQLIPAWGEDGELRPVDKLEAHRLGLRHPAISVFVMDGAGRTLLQQRAAGKYHTPLKWANACCTHPHWGEGFEACAVRRLGEELGVTLAVAERGEVSYRADVGGGLIENEVVRIFTAQAPEGFEIRPNPEEVADVRWSGLPELREAVARDPDAYTPWLRIYLAEHAGMIFGDAD